MYIEKPIILETNDEKKELAAVIRISMEKAFRQAFSIMIRTEELTSGVWDFSIQNETMRLTPFQANNIYKYLTGMIGLDELRRHTETMENIQIISTTLDPQLREIEKRMKRIIKIARREKIRYTEVVLSEKYRAELNALTTPQESKLRLKEIIVKFTNGILQEKFIGILAIAPSITDDQYREMREEILRDTESMKMVKRKTIALFIAYDEEDVKESMDSEVRKDKRTVLLKLLEETEKKMLTELISSLMNSTLVQEVEASV